MKKLSKVGVVVVTFNKCKLLQKNLFALINQSYKVSQIIVVDNFSNDGTKEYMMRMIKLYSNIHYMRIPKNVGGAGGFYFGIKYLVKFTNVDLFWLMDDDTLPLRDSLSELINVSNRLHGQFGFLSSNVRFSDGHAAIMNVPRTSFDWTEPLYMNIIKIKSGTFVSFLIPRYIVMNIGLPIKEFFIWSDDTEYSERISKKYSSYFVPRSIVIHNMKNNFGLHFISENDSKRLSRYFYSFRNNLYIEKKKGISSYIRYILSICKQILFLVFSHVPYKFNKIKILINGLISGIIFNPKIEYIENK